MLTVILLFGMLLILLQICLKIKNQFKSTSETSNDGRKNLDIMVPMKYLNNVLWTLVMFLINCKINIDLLATAVANPG